MNPFHTTGTIEEDIDADYTKFVRPVIDPNSVCGGGRLYPQQETQNRE